jgi:hypothetical protein
MNGLAGRTALKAVTAIATAAAFLAVGLGGPASAQTVPHAYGTSPAAAVDAGHVTAAMTSSRTVVQVQQSSLYSASKHPAVAITHSGSAVEVGTRITFSTSGTIKAIRFYKGGSVNGGRHVGSLWSSTNVLLRRQVFGHESASGWQSVLLSKPLTVIAGETIIVSYSAPQGGFSRTDEEFSHRVQSGPLAANVGAGLLSHKAGAVPAARSRVNAGYLVDVVFTHVSRRTIVVRTPSPQSVGWTASGITTLKPYRGPLMITKSGTVLDGVDITGSIVIAANNVTIRRSRISSTTDWYAVRQYPEFHGLKLSYTEVTALPGAVPDMALSAGTNAALDHVYIHGMQRGVFVTSGMSITNSYLDDFVNNSDSHAQAILALGRTNHVRIINNVLGCGTNMCTAALSVFPEQGANTDWVIDSNVLNGGSFAVYLGYSPQNGEHPNTNIRFTNNVFGTKYWPTSGQYGPVASWSNVPSNTWANNSWFTDDDRDGYPVSSQGGL